MKIIQIITGSSSFGGAEAHVRDLAVGLIEQGHDCTVMVGPPQGLLSTQLRAAGVPVMEIPALRKPIHPLLDAICLVQVIRALRGLQPDIIATHTSKAGFIGRIAAAILRIPSFFTPHGLSFIHRATGKPIRFRLALERLALPLKAQVIAVCDAERHLALRMLPLDPTSIFTVHNGIPDHAPAPRFTQSPVVITMVARFDQQKDHVTLFKALAELLHLDWTLRLAGSGPLLPAMKRLAAEYNLVHRTEFLEECSNVPDLLAATDIFALITNWEAFPISILEAMREGLPILATDIGGVNEAVHDGVNGFLVARQDTTCVAHRLSSLIRCADLRARMGEQSRKRFCETFASHQMLEKTTTLYRSALAKPSTQPHIGSLGPAPFPRDSMEITRTPKEPYAIPTTSGHLPQ
jgi:glycosyltransferase involved in cell wall biosynthesis